MSTPDSSSISERDVWLGLSLEGDRVALGKLLAAHRSYLRTLARAQIHRGLQGKADASDLVQETCLQAQMQLSKFRGKTPQEFTGWLRGILANLLAKHFRHYYGTKQRDIRLEQSLLQQLDSTSGCLERSITKGAPSPSQIVMQQESMLELADALESLPEDYRTVILLRNIEGLPFREIAEAMQRSVDSVEKLWVRGLAKLKSAMDTIGINNSHGG